MTVETSAAGLANSFNAEVNNLPDALARDAKLRPHFFQARHFVALASQPEEKDFLISVRQIRDKRVECSHQFSRIPSNLSEFASRRPFNQKDEFCDRILATVANPSQLLQR